MFIYDEKENTLTICKVKNPEIELDLFADQKESYRRYLEETIYADMEFLLEKLKAKHNIPDMTIKVTVKPLYKTTFKKDIKKLGNSYYPVEVEFKDGIYDKGKFPILKIPYLDDFCKLNVDGKRKVIINEQRPAEDISFDQNRSTFNITLPAVNISISTQSRAGIKIKHGDKKFEALELVARAGLLDQGLVLHDQNGNVVPFSEYFSNSFLLRTITTNPYFVEELNAATIGELGIWKKYQQPIYRLGETRDALNSALSIDACLMQTLSRDTVGYVEGTIITKEILNDLKRKRVNVVYVKAVPHIDGMILDNDKPMYYTEIPAGTKNCALLQEKFPKLKKFAYIPEDIQLDMEDPIYIPDGTKLSKEEIELMAIMGERSVTIKRKVKGLDERITFKFEREIAGNYTARLSDLLDNIPDGRNADEWVYYYNNPNLDKVDDAYLNAHDMTAIMSMLARIFTTGENPLLNRDTSYLKRIDMINEAFSKNLRKVIPTYIGKNVNAMHKWLSGKTSLNPFFGLNSSWIRSILEAKILAEADTVNIAAEVTQVCHVSTIVQNAASVAEEMRFLAIPFLGRLCPYETPSGKKLGLVNTKAIGSKVRNGFLVAPYRRVKKTSNGISISNIIEYLTVKEEMNYKIGDILSLVMDENGRYYNNKIIARLPNPEADGDKVILGEINAYELDYVNAHTEQHLSPTATMMPFACANDANRVTFGLNMIRQAIYIQDSQSPAVSTFMYKDLFKYSNAFLIRAKKDGFVIDIGTNMLMVQYNDGTSEEFTVPETRITNDSVTFLNYRVKTGDSFQKDDILVDSSVSRDGKFSPARNTLVAYISTGYNYEDAVDTCELGASEYVSINSHAVDRKLSKSEKASVNIGSANKFKYVPEGGVITDLSMLLDNDSKKKYNTSIFADHASGIFYDTDKLVDESGAITYRCHLLGFNKLRQGDKMAGRHGNKGVVSNVQLNSLMPMLNNGKIIKFMFNPSGVPSRMNLGQIDEAHLGLAAYILQIKTNSDSFNGATLADISLLLTYAYELANCESYASAEAIVKRYPMLEPSFHKHSLDHLDEIQDWKDSFFPDGTARLWNQETEEYYEYPILIGYVYFLKLVHEIDEKMHARAGMLEEIYNQVNKQPPKGASKGGGQKMGEMELCAIAAYGAQEILREILNEKSDNVGGRANIHLDQLGYSEHVPEEYCVPRALEMFIYELEVLGIHTEINDPSLPSFDYDTSIGKMTLDVRTLIKNKIRTVNEITRKSTDDILDSIYEANNI